MSESLTDFLLARIAEDEAGAREPRWLALEYGVDSYGQRMFADRVLAECEAKRRMLERMADADWDSREEEHFHKLLALPYADHDDYREEWRP